MPRLCRRGLFRKISHWAIEPAIGLGLVWLIFQMLFNSQTKTLVISEDKIDFDLEGGVELGQEKNNPIKNGEELLFMERQPGRILQTKQENQKDAVKHEDKVKMPKVNNIHVFLLGNGVEEEDDPVVRVLEQEPKKKEESHEETKIVIPNYETQKECRGRRWSLTSKTEKIYYVVGYKSKLLTSEDCKSPACDLNQGRTPLRVDLSATPCKTEECLTVVLKTRFRYENCIRFILSIHDIYPNLKVIVLDEEDREGHVNKSSIAVWENFMDQKKHLVSYVQAPPGVGYGRKLGAQLAQTKYILVVDDDYLFTKLSNVSRLIEVLERSDATIVGGDTSDGFPYAGALRIARNKTGASEEIHLAIYPNVFYELAQCFRNCFVSDIVKTFFVADRRKILEFGAWDSERKFYEHEDFFINMRKAGLKVVNCKDIKVRHVPIDQNLAVLRRESFEIWHKHLLKKWDFKDMYICDKSTYADSSTTCSQQRHFY